jgi:hypothetical protein
MQLKNIFIASLLSIPLIGCSVHRAANQPSAKDTSVMSQGVHRDHLIAEFGAPISSEQLEDGRKDIYSFIQGYSKGNKAGRAFFHGAADLLTIGLWEIVGTPVEGTFDGKRMNVRVIYDENDLVKSSEVLSVSDP